MNMLFLFLYIVYGLMAPTTTNGASIDFSTTKPIFCVYWGNNFETQRPSTPVTNATSLPEECEVILFSAFSMSPDSKPVYQEKYLNQALQLNRPVLLHVTRSEGFKGWSKILKPDGNEIDAKALTEFVKSKGIAGVIIDDITPEFNDDVADGLIAKYIIPYICQMKINDDFIVGVWVEPMGDQLLDPSVVDFEAMKPIVDLYVVDTLRTHSYCKVELFNGLAPIKTINGLHGIDTIITQIGNTEIAIDRVYLISSILVVNPDKDSEYLSHSEVCETTNDTSKWCVPTTKDYYEKGKFFHEKNFGTLIMWPELDDIENLCGCCPFIAIINIAAGYNGKQQTPCAKFDIKDNAS